MVILQLKAPLELFVKRGEFLPGSGFLSCWIPISWLAWSLYKCVALWSAVYGASATERLVGTICKEMENLFRFRVSILSLYHLSC